MEQIFKDNPSLDEVYQTSDGKFFYIENDARNHAFKLENKKVEKLICPPKEEKTIQENKGNEKKEVTQEVKNIQEIVTQQGEEKKK